MMTANERVKAEIDASVIAVEASEIPDVDRRCHCGKANARLAYSQPARYKFKLCEQHTYRHVFLCDEHDAFAS